MKVMKVFFSIWFDASCVRVTASKLVIQTCSNFSQLKALFEN